MFEDGEQTDLPSNAKVLKKIDANVIRLLARREHSRYELTMKMLQRGYCADDIDTVLDELEQKATLSDARFAEAYCYHRRQKGFGPLRIGAELKERRIAEHLILENINESDSYWFDAAAKIRTKKFGDHLPANFAEKAKQMRYLSQKGYTHDHITYALESCG